MKAYQVVQNLVLKRLSSSSFVISRIGSAVLSQPPEPRDPSQVRKTWRVTLHCYGWTSCVVVGWDLLPLEGGVFVPCTVDYIKKDGWYEELLIDLVGHYNRFRKKMQTTSRRFGYLPGMPPFFDDPRNPNPTTGIHTWKPVTWPQVSATPPVAPVVPKPFSRRKETHGGLEPTNTWRMLEESRADFSIGRFLEMVIPSCSSLTFHQPDGAIWIRMTRNSQTVCWSVQCQFHGELIKTAQRNLFKGHQRSPFYHVLSNIELTRLGLETWQRPSCLTPCPGGCGMPLWCAAVGIVRPRVSQDGGSLDQYPRANGCKCYAKATAHFLKRKWMESTPFCWTLRVAAFFGICHWTLL